MFHVALYHPAIPQNTGNIARTTVGFGAHLHLIHPMKFEITDHAVKRAGLDYWPSVKLTEHESDDAFLAWLDSHTKKSDANIWLVTKFGDTRFDQPAYRDGDVFLFGNENTGLPPTWHDPREFEQQHGRPSPFATPGDGGRLHIPMPGHADGAPNIRSLNVANTVAIVLATATAAILEPG